MVRSDYSACTVAIHVPNLNGGGAERMMVNLANEFVSRDINTHLVLSQIKGPYTSEVDDAVDIVNLDASPYPGFAAMGALLPLRNYLRQKEPDTLLSALSIVNIVSLLAHQSSRVDTRIVVSQRNHLSSIASNSDNMMKIVPWLVRLTYRWADDIIPISEGVADDLQNITGISLDDMKTIYNPVINDSITTQANKAPGHPWLNESKNEFPVIIGVGRLTQQKDFSTLIKAFSRLQKQQKCRLIILGEGEQRDHLDKLIKERNIQDGVDMPGFVGNPFAYMARSDIFVLSSRWEGFGNVIVEAMACGTPVVSTDCPSGPAEILQNGRYGPLVPIGDCDSLVNAIKKNLEDPISELELKRRANDFTVSDIAEQYLDILLNTDK